MRYKSHVRISWKKFLIPFLLLLLLLGKLDFSHKKQKTCPFCDQKVLENQVFYEGEQSFGALTYKPAVEGHVLIIPRRHIERFEELTEEEMLDIKKTIQRVDFTLKKRIHTEDYLLLQKNGRKVGQSVPHLHFHYIPESRFLALKFLISPWLRPLGEEKLLKLKEKFSYQPEEDSMWRVKADEWMQ